MRVTDTLIYMSVRIVNSTVMEWFNMDEIKFRAWDKENNRMIYQSKNICFHIADEFVGIDNNSTNNYIEFSWLGSLNTILMQFTGLQDKNEKDIFIGDIISYGKYYGGTNLDDTECLHIVKWDQINAKVITSEIATNEASGSIDNGVCVVVGNIYQNTELLSDKNE